MRSKTGTSITIVRFVKDRSVAVGIMKPDAIVLSLLAPCMVKNVEYCASTMAYNRFVALIGINPWHCLRFSIFINTAYPVFSKAHIQRKQGFVEEPVTLEDPNFQVKELLYLYNIKVPVVHIEFLLLELVTAFMGQGSMISFHGLHIPRCCNENLTNSRKEAISFFGLITISLRSKQEENQCKNHHETGNPKSKKSAHVIFCLRSPQGLPPSNRLAPNAWIQGLRPRCPTATIYIY